MGLNRWSRFGGRTVLRSHAHFHPPSLRKWLLGPRPRLFKELFALERDLGQEEGHQQHCQAHGKGNDKDVVHARRQGLVHGGNELVVKLVALGAKGRELALDRGLGLGIGQPR